MLRPSYSELMDVINEEKNIDSKITSRYTIVVATAKRARQLIDGALPLSTTHTDKAVSIAVCEMNEGKIIIKTNNEGISIKERENYVMEASEGYMSYQFSDLQYSEKPKKRREYEEDEPEDDDDDDDDNDGYDD